MDDVLAQIGAKVVSITDQLALLNWPLILSGVGICEAAIKRRANVKLWILPVILGSVFGGFTFVAHNAFTTLLNYIALLVESSLIYAGWITLVYLFVRPVKYLGDWVKNRSAGKQGG